MFCRFALDAFVVAVAVDDGVEVACVYGGCLGVRFRRHATTRFCNHLLLTWVKRSRMTQLVVSWKRFGENKVVAVVVAKYTNEIAVEFFESWLW